MSMNTLSVIFASGKLGGDSEDFGISTLDGSSMSGSSFIGSRRASRRSSITMPCDRCNRNDASIVRVAVNDNRLIFLVEIKVRRGGDRTSLWLLASVMLRDSGFLLSGVGREAVVSTYWLYGRVGGLGGSSLVSSVDDELMMMDT